MAIETFTLNKERCLLANINLRGEKHGKESKPAVDLSFEFSSANNLLLKLHPQLRNAFYRADGTMDMLDSDHMPHLRYPLLGPQSWELEIPRTMLRIHDVDNQKHDVVLSGGKTNKFQLTMMNGGTVKWKFRVQFSQPDEDSIAKLMRVMNQTVPVTLECADEETETDNFEKVEQLSITGTGPSAARLEAESLFDKPPTTLALGADTPASTTDDSTVKVEDVHAGENSGGNVTPIKPKRTTKTAPVDAAPAGAPVISEAKAKRVSRKATSEIE